MNKNLVWRGLLRSGLALLLTTGISLSMAGCKKNEGDAAPTAGDAGAKGAPKGPCEQYAEKLCEAAGKESPTCQSIQNTTELMPPAACTAGLRNIEFSTKKLAEKGKKCDELVTKLCAELGPESETCNMVKNETKKFPPERCGMMLEHYTEVVADLKRHEARNKPLSPEIQASLVAGNAPGFGPEDAKVKVVEFSDFECPYCSRAAEVANKVKEKYGNQVRFVFRQFPLSFHKNAKEAAEASLAAHEQGKFWEYHDKLFQNQKQLDSASLEEYAKQTGLDVKAFKQALEQDKFAPQVEADLKLGEQAAVQGTPTLFINGTRVQNPADFDEVARLIDEALKG
jgi:protein-disulfide isomerase